MSKKFLEQLSQDFTKLLENNINYDVVMEIGEGDDTKTFKVHSAILSARSPYFERAFSNQWKKIEGDSLKLSKPNIRPDIFKGILRFIYGGKVEINELNAKDILDLLVAVDELCMVELFHELQEHLINNETDWIKKNIIYVHKVIFEHDMFEYLQDHWYNIVFEEPSILFEAEDFPEFEESVLIEILKMDELKIDEIDIWINVIKWAMAKFPKNPTSIVNWSDKDIGLLKETLENIIPLIRFYTMTSDEFYQHIKPYSKILDNLLYDDILQYHLVKNWKPSIIQILPQRSRPAKTSLNHIINDLAPMISSWLDKRDLNSNFFPEIVYRISSAGAVQHEVRLNKYIYKPYEVPYRFRPIPYQNKLASDENKILTLYKLSNENKIIGEYNHIYVKGISVTTAADSFRFSLHINENRGNKFINIAFGRTILKFTFLNEIPKNSFSFQIGHNSKQEFITIYDEHFFCTGSRRLADKFLSKRYKIDEVKSFKIAKINKVND